MDQLDNIDFKALDPQHDPVAWQRVLEEVVERAWQARRTLSVADLMARWSRPLVAICATLAIVVWTGEWLSRPLDPHVSDRQLVEPSAGRILAADASVTSTTDMLEIMFGVPASANSSLTPSGSLNNVLR